MARGMAVSYVYSDFHLGSPCRLDHLEHALADYSASAVIRLCSYLNALRLSAEFHRDQRIAEWILRSAFPPERAEEMLRGRKASPPRFVFHRPQLLLIAKTAARSRQQGTRDPIEDPHLGTFGDALLIANELLRYDLPTETEQELESHVLVNFAAIADHIGEALGPIIVRSYVSTEILEQYRKDEHFREFFDLPAKFEADLHMTIPEYRAATLAAVAKYVLLNASDVLLKDGCIDFEPSLRKFALTAQWFGNTVSGEKLGYFLGDCSSAALELAKPCEESPFIYDFTVFRDKPLFQIGDAYYPVDVGFLANKIEVGPFWHVQRGLTRKEGERCLAFWARIFEGYVQWLLHNSVDNQKNRFVANPLFTPKRNEKREISDGVVQCGSFAVLIECKGGFFGREAKYSGDPEVLRKTITEKLIRTDEGDRKGIEQLASSISLLFARTTDEKADDPEIGAATWVYPVLIVREPLVDAPGINRLLNREFGKLIERRKFRVKVESLFCLSAADLEGIAPLLTETRLTDILDARKAEDRNLFMPFAVALAEFIEAKTDEGGGCIAEKFSEIMKEVATQLFPEEAARVTPDRQP